MKPLALAALLGMLLTPTVLCAGEIVCRFDTGTAPEVNDFGERTGTGACTLSPPGSGCPAHPQGRALDTGEPGGAANAIEIPLAAATSLAQGTLEAWVKSTWDWSSDREHHAFLSIKMEGGTWQSLSLYHHGRMGDARALAFNIYDGIDNCILTPVEALGWRQGEWHHLAASWTPNSEWLFADGRLVAKRLTEGPVSFSAPAGPLRIGGPGLWGSAAGVLIDEVRFVDQALYAGLESIPVPTAPLPERLPARLLARAGVTLTASSTMASLSAETDVAELHNGSFGETVWINGAAGTWVRCDLPQRGTIAAVRWSRDGRPLKGPDDWADARHIPRDFVIEASLDGTHWQPLVERRDFWYDPAQISREGMVFEHRFPPLPATAVRLVVSKGQPGGLGPGTALDEFQVLDPAGANLAREAKVVTARTSSRRDYSAAQLIDGRIGEGSCWRAAQPGEALIEIVLPAPCAVRTLTWSRSAEGLPGAGTPKAMVVEAWREGAWVEIGRLADHASPGRHDLALTPTTAARLRLRILSTTDGKEPTLDEITLH